MSRKRDAQRGRVYAWENRVIAPRDTTLVALGVAQAMVDAIWEDMGLQYPPGVEVLPRQSRATLASATRLSIFLPAQIPSWCLLHELAHAMTSDINGGSDGHGPIFMGVYLKLVSRYLRIDHDHLLKSAIGDGVDVTSNAKPTFVDAGAPGWTYASANATRSSKPPSDSNRFDRPPPDWVMTDDRTADLNNLEGI